MGLSRFTPTPPGKSVSRGIGARLGLALTAAVSLSLIVFAGIVVAIDVARGAEFLESKLSNALRQGQTSLAEPLWNVDADTVQRFIDAMMLDSELVFVIVRDEGGNVVGLGHPTGDLVEIQRESSDLLESAEILYEDAVVGSIEVALSGEGLERDLVQRVLVILLLALFMVGATSATAVAITRRYISRPLLALEDSARTIAGGDLEVPVDTRAGDEIGSLARSLDRMRASIRDLLSALQKSNDQLAESNRSLEDSVKERTVQLERAVSHAEDARARAEAANVAKSTFLANMSHELRTPLNAILGFAQLMRRDHELSPKHGETLETIESSGEHLLTLINDVLDVSKIEAGQIALEAEPVDLHSLLEDVRAMFELRASEKGLALDVNITEEVPRVAHLDKGKIGQVLINLLGNAVKFTTDGHVTLRVDATQQDSHGKFAFEVEDSGPGMSAEELEHLFEPFTQADAGRRAQQGAGLGLHLSRTFVELMGGQLEVDSQVGRGSTFRFEILAELGPDGAIDPALETRHVMSIAPGQRHCRILVVEDMRESRLLLSAFMEDLGFETRCASDGREALAVWKEWKPHLVWMDIRMPVMDGLEATRRIKDQPQGKDTAVIALTASAFEEERERILAHGCDDFVRKPFREDDLIDIMTRHLGLQFTHVAAPEAKTGLLSEELELGTLPDGWLPQLQTAGVRADADRVHELLDEIRDEHPEVARTIAALVRDYKFNDIVEMTNTKSS